MQADARHTGSGCGREKIDLLAGRTLLLGCEGRVFLSGPLPGGVKSAVNGPGHRKHSDRLMVGGACLCMRRVRRGKVRHRAGVVLRAELWMLPRAEAHLRRQKCRVAQ
ncbi:hypothetical protein NDU88_006238 [Pleurodeles waltl]|uniref:Uncharacterized protein n=1 Tax=Pleurodeles waltl TaxID=8319 RepID=A0AAV7RL10_PLEWA|nr:hypothetical protein NDU88_006238 [Pleurodeles waltl]